MQRILARPSARAGFVALAEYHEARGNTEEARVLYRGNVPVSIRERYNLETMESTWAHDMPDYEQIGWHPAESVSLESIANEDASRDTCFDAINTETPTNYCGLLQNATLVFDGNNRLVVDQQGVRNINFSTVNSFLLASHATDTSQHSHLSGITLLLSARNSHNFYHWQMECLPLLGMLESAGIPLSSIDHILLNRKDAGFQLHTLRRLGIEDSQIVWIDDLPATFRCDSLALCRLTNSMGMAYRVGNLDWLRSQHWDNTRAAKRSGKIKLAVRRDVRGFTDNDAVYNTLEKRGYRVIYPEHYRYEEQVSLFRQASHIVAPHGAALSLTVYCAPDTEVHEFYGAHVHPCFYAISGMSGQRYHNYNCATDATGTQVGNKGLSERLKQTIDLDPGLLDSLNL